MRRHLVAAAVSASLFAALPNARAHDWYPIECCGGKDCAPADTVVRRDDGSYLVMAQGVSMIIPDGYHWRQSPDGQVHVCVRPVGGVGLMVVCAFRGSGV